MRSDQAEIRHSNILAWLLDPRETHHLGDRFLRMFLSEATRRQSHLGSPTAIEISQADLRDAEVRREWQSIDILIVLPRLNWAFVIENKYHSRQYAGQLIKYAERVRSTFESSSDKLKVRGIFLTLHDENADDDSFVHIRYATICEFLPRLIADSPSVLRDDVRMFLHQYLEIIMEDTGMSQEHKDMELLARQLYRSHKKVLDFIWEHGDVNGFERAVELVFGEHQHDKVVDVSGLPLRFHGGNHRQVSFLPADWIKSLGGSPAMWPGCEKWWAGYPLICWIELSEKHGSSGQLRLIAEVGPVKNHKARQAIISRIEEAASRDGLKTITFRRGASGEGSQYSKFLNRDSLLEIRDTQDEEEIANAMKLLVKKFQPTFISVGSALNGLDDYARIAD